MFCPPYRQCVDFSRLRIVEIGNSAAEYSEIGAGVNYGIWYLVSGLWSLVLSTTWQKCDISR